MNFKIYNKIELIYYYIKMTNKSNSYLFKKIPVEYTNDIKKTNVEIEKKNIIKQKVFDGPHNVNPKSKNDKNDIKKYILSDDIYNKEKMKRYMFNDNINTIMVKAGMGMGKTKMLEPLIDDFEDKTIVIVSFRVTLDKEYSRNFEGFELYSNIKENVYDIDIYKRIVVQIDSFHKIRGNIDLLVLDEFTYTSMHIVSSVKYKEAVVNTLLEYIQNKNNKIIVMDALLDIETIKWFHYENRSIHYIENQYEKHNDKIVYNYNNNIGTFMRNIYKYLKDNKKIILATNSKTFLNNLENKLNQKMPDIKYKFYNADNSDDINIDNWNKYDIVGYTPTIVAGVSYEKFHFDKCFGYFVNSSAPAEMGLQQLFRVRNIEDKEIHICVEKLDNNEYPLKKFDIEKNIIDKNTCLVDGVMGVKLSRINKTILKDSYFYLYRNCQIKIFNSRNNYENSLIGLLKRQGIRDIRTLKDNSNDENKQARQEMRETSKTIKDIQLDDIINSDELDDDDYIILKDKVNKTYKEKNMIKKKKFRLNLYYDGPITRDMYKKYSVKYKQFKNINIFYTLKDELMLYLKNNIELIEGKKIDKNVLVETGDTDFRNNKLLTANTYILHADKTYEKYIIGLEILYLFGIDDIFTDKGVYVDYDKLIKYLKNREYTIRLLFGCKKFNMNEINNDKKGYKEIMKYFNSRLRTIFNIYLKEDNYNNNYKITNLDFWCGEINPKQINETLKMEMYISSMLKDIQNDDD